jgi:hypothetical protein
MHEHENGFVMYKQSTLNLSFLSISRQFAYTSINHCSQGEGGQFAALE